MSQLNPWKFGAVLSVLVLAVWSYVIGAIYALTRNWLRPDTDRG